MALEFEHRPVLLKEVIRCLEPKPGGVYIDGTLGGAGHAYEILKLISPGGRLLGIDRDDRALQAAAQRLMPYREQTVLARGNYAEMDRLAGEHGITGADGVLLDIGVSSPQLDESERGFSYRTSAPLDMRMDQRQSLTARELVNQLPQDQLARIIFEYGEEKFSRRIASRIAREREESPIETTDRLAQIVKEAIPAAARRTGPHPSRRTFQALRIAVNDELGSLRRGIEAAVKILRPGGRLAVITFHSLEDRICKDALAGLSKECLCPPELPVCICNHRPALKMITRKPVTAGEEELHDNPRSRSAKLRAAERLDQGRPGE